MSSKKITQQISLFRYLLGNLQCENFVKKIADNNEKYLSIPAPLANKLFSRKLLSRYSYTLPRLLSFLSLWAW